MRKAHLQKTLVTTATLLLVADYAPGQLVMYEPSWGTFAEDQGWVHTANCDPVRLLNDGWFVQHVDFTDCEIQPNIEQDNYRIAMEYLTGAPTFFLEWESMSDGPPTELIFTAPSSIVAASNLGAVNYHFTIADERIRFIRDVNHIPIIWVDIDSEIPHVYRLEHNNFGIPWYRWTIDGVIADEGPSEGPFPSTNPIFYPAISFRAKSMLTSSTTRWRYIRAGEIPVSGSLDFTNDGLIEHLDYYLFRDYLSGPEAPHARGWSVGDADGDADIDLADFAALQNHFTGDE